MSDDPFTSPKVTDAVGTTANSHWTCLFSGLFGFLVVGVGIVMVAILPMMGRGRHYENTGRLREIGRALHNYHDDFGSFPPAYTVDESGLPLHSWRTLLLPYLEQHSLYETIDLSKPWNDPSNAQAFETPVPVYRHLASGNHTNYLGVSGPNTVFAGTNSVTLSEISDGTSNTLLVVEVPKDRTVPWMTPLDTDDVAVWGTDSNTEHSDGRAFYGLLGDGSAKRIGLSIDQTTLQSLLTISGGEPVVEY